MTARPFVELLVITLCLPEAPHRSDLGGDPALEVGLLLGERLPGRGRLLGREREDGASVLVADVRTLAVGSRRIVRVQEHAQQTWVANGVDTAFNGAALPASIYPQGGP